MEHPKVVEDLVPKLLPLAAVQRVLQNLLRERVAIRDSVTILEALGEAAATIRNPILVTEYVRQSLRRMVVKPYLNANGELPAYLLDPSLEQLVESAIEHGEQSSHLTLAPRRFGILCSESARKPEIRKHRWWPSPARASRYFLRQIAEPSIRNLFFISNNEIPAEVRIVSLGVIQ